MLWRRNLSCRMSCPRSPLCPFVGSPNNHQLNAIISFIFSNCRPYIQDDACCNDGMKKTNSAVNGIINVHHSATCGSSKSIAERTYKTTKFATVVTVPMERVIAKVARVSARCGVSHYWQEYCLLRTENVKVVDKTWERLVRLEVRSIQYLPLRYTALTILVLCGDTLSVQTVLRGIEFSGKGIIHVCHPRIAMRQNMTESVSVSTTADRRQLT
jgi:hypothetical protein